MSFGRAFDAILQYPPTIGVTPDANKVSLAAKHTKLRDTPVNPVVFLHYSS